jgi:DNA-binding CsgD family transcriptional regulator
MKNNNFQLQTISETEFYEYWDINKSAKRIDKSILVNFFKPYIETIPRLALGEYYWQIFENTQPLPKIVMVDGAVEALTPTNAKGLMEANFEVFFSFFHPDDLKQVMTFVAKFFEILFAIESEKRKNYNFNIYARVRNGKGEYLWNSIQYPALYFDETGTLLFGMTLYTNVSHLIKDNTEPILTILDTTNKNKQVFTCYTPSNTLGIQKPYPKITKREREIVALLSQGKSSKQISDILNISKNTVDNHRQNLLKKFEVTSSAELVIKAAML